VAGEVLSRYAVNAKLVLATFLNKQMTEIGWRHIGQQILATTGETGVEDDRGTDIAWVEDRGHEDVDVSGEHTESLVAEAVEQHQDVEGDIDKATDEPEEVLAEEDLQKLLMRLNRFLQRLVVNQKRFLLRVDGEAQKFITEAVEQPRMLLKILPMLLMNQKRFQLRWILQRQWLNLSRFLQ
jgi:hypothetical protein